MSALSSARSVPSAPAPTGTILTAVIPKTSAVASLLGHLQDVASGATKLESSVAKDHARTKAKQIRLAIEDELRAGEPEEKLVAFWRRAFDLVVKHVHDSTYYRRVFKKLVDVQRDPNAMGEPYALGNYGFDERTMKAKVGKMRIVYSCKGSELTFKFIDFHDETYEDADKARGAK